MKRQAEDLIQSKNMKYTVRLVADWIIFVGIFFLLRYAFSRLCPLSSLIRKHKRSMGSRQRFWIRVFEVDGNPGHRPLKLACVVIDPPFRSFLSLNFSLILFFLPPQSTMTPPRFVPWTPEEDKLLTEAVAACEYAPMLDPRMSTMILRSRRC